LTLFSLCISVSALSACGGGGTSVAGQVRTVMIDQNTLDLQKADTWTDVPTIITLETTETATLTALFVSGFHESNKEDHWIKVRILLDGEPMLPGEATVVSQTSATPSQPDTNTVVDETHSFMAMKANVPPGQHKVTVQWKASLTFVRDQHYFLSGPVLTVWEGIYKS
jgi:hypothetical protein